MAANFSGGAAPDLSPILRQKQVARQQFGAQSAANTFAKNLSQQRGSRRRTDFTQGFGRQLPKFTSQFGARGLAGGGVQSGVMQQAMQNYIGDYTRDLGRMDQDLADNQREFDFNQARFQSELDSTLANLEAEQQRRIAETAMHIASLRPYMGGF